MTIKQSEKQIETYLRDQLKKIGGIAMKFVSPGHAGVPDRIVIFNSQVIFVELKAPGKEPSPLQKATHTMLRSKGVRVEIIDSKEQIKNFIHDIQTT